MLSIDYRCIKCGKEPSNKSMSMICSCGGDIRGQSCGINGTRDSFGIKREFYDKQTGQTIDNWKKWERAGFRDPLTESHLSPDHKRLVKEKQKAIKRGYKKTIHFKDI